MPSELGSKSDNKNTNRISSESYVVPTHKRDKSRAIRENKGLQRGETEQVQSDCESVNDGGTLYRHRSRNLRSSVAPRPPPNVSDHHVSDLKTSTSYAGAIAEPDLVRFDVA